MNITKRDSVLYSHQEEPKQFLLNNDGQIVLAMCPSSGKTEVVINTIIDILNKTPNTKILILPHSTNIILQNFIGRLNEINISFNWSTSFEEDAQVHVCLPTKEKHIKGIYDIIVIDEGHENVINEQEKDNKVEYRIDKILKKNKNVKKVWILTGTPAKFIKKGGYKIYTLAMNDIPIKYFAKLNLELITTNINWKNYYNSDDNLKQEYEPSFNDVEQSIKDVINALIRRLKTKTSAEYFNHSYHIKESSHSDIFHKLNKTLVIAKSKKHADKIYENLKEKNISCILSHSGNDDESDFINDFKDNKYKVLIVVNRARIGYDDVNLYNIIDMSGTHNISLLYQIIARVIRTKQEERMEKFYLKLTTNEFGMKDYTHACVSAALMLMDKKYLSTFTGNNFKGVIIPSIKQSKTISLDSNFKSKIRNRKNRNLVLPEFGNDVIDMFRNISNDLDKPVSIYKAITIDEVKYRLEIKNRIPKELCTLENYIASVNGEINFTKKIFS